MSAKNLGTARAVALKLTESGFTDVGFVLKNGVPLSVIEKQSGMLVASGYLTILINDFNTSLNVSSPMNPTQVADLAEELLKEYFDYTIEDFISFFHLAKRGQFQDKETRIMGRIDMQIIFGLLKNYDKIRLEKVKEMDNDYKLSSPAEHENTIDVPFGLVAMALKAGRQLTIQEAESVLKRPLNEKEKEKYIDIATLSECEKHYNKKYSEEERVEYLRSVGEYLGHELTDEEIKYYSK